MMKDFTTNTASKQAADVGICFKAIKAFQEGKTISHTIEQRLHSKIVGKAFSENGLIEVEKPSPSTCRKYIFLLLYQWFCMRSLSFRLIRNNDGYEK